LTIAFNRMGAAAFVLATLAVAARQEKWLRACESLEFLQR
jgi:hypothetical protein